MRKLGSLLLVCASATTACKSTARQDASEAKMDIALEPAMVNAAQLRDFIARFQEIVAAGRGQLDPGYALGFFPLLPAERAVVDTMQYQPLQATCNSNTNVCELQTVGAIRDGVRVTLSQVRLPGVGSPTLWVAPRLRLLVKLHGPERFELCRVEGIQIKKGVWVGFDGALFDITNNNYVIDVGSFGSYPKRC